jgi:hypothetical protein
VFGQIIFWAKIPVFLKQNFDKKLERRKIQHEHGHAPWMGMQNGPAAWTYSLDMDMQHGHRDAARAYTCTLDIHMQHGLAHAA